MTLTARRSARMIFVACLLGWVGSKGYTALAGSESPVAGPSLLRLATLPIGAEVTGLHLGDQGELFLNAQHPAGSNRSPFDRATVGYIDGLDFRRLPRDLAGVPVPGTPKERESVRVAAGEYRILARAGETLQGAFPDGLGAITAADGERVIKRSDDPDFNGLVPAGEGRAFLFTAWEDRPGGMSRLALVRKAGRWSVTGEGSRMLDFSGVRGTWVDCFGTVTPWGTPLASEEAYAVEKVAAWNDPDADAAFWRRGVGDLAGYLGYGDPRRAWPNPYRYGYIVEITDPAGAAAPRKRFALGRFAHENAVVMPDRRTVYLSDDGTGTNQFRFVADEAGDLSAGTLYAARLAQDPEETDPAATGFDVAWIRLGHGGESRIAEWIARFDGVTRADFTPGGNSYITEAEVAAWAAHRRKGQPFPGIDVDDDGRIGEGDIRDPRAVAFLESRRAAAALGATAEFRKMEGVNARLEKAGSEPPSFLYLAVARIEGAMADGRGDIRLEPSPCGAVYRLSLGPDLVARRMEPVAGGRSVGGGSGASTPCPADHLANPDNLVVLPDGRLVVGEDTGYHQSNMVWLIEPSPRRE